MTIFEADSCVDSVIRPTLILRIFPPVITVLVALSLFIFKGAPHDFCLGLALGMLIALSIVSFDMTWKRDDSAHSDSGLLGSLLRSGADKAP